MTDKTETTSDVQAMPSNRDQLLMLDIGETLSRSVAVSYDKLKEINEIKLAYRRVWSSPIARAKAHAGYEYTMETVEVLTPAGNVFVVILITRTA